MAMAEKCRKSKTNNPERGVEAAYMASTSMETVNIPNLLLHASEQGYSADGGISLWK